ncbi:unnamed protein product, partial [Laminaria digitata]
GIVEDASVESDLFSPPWLEQYSGGAPGCKLGRGSYRWRGCGLGSNVNNLLNSWVYSLAVEDWSELSLIFNDIQFQSLNCFNESAGLVSQGWGCLFSSIPHVCVFDTAQAWKAHLLSANVSDEDLNTINGLNLDTIRKSRKDIANSLQGLNIDHLGALAVMAKYLWSFMTPWLRNDVHFVTHAEKAFNGSAPFLGIHIRRGDKIKEAKAVAVEVWLTREYLKAAVDFFEEESSPTGVDGIKAIWVASDDPGVVDEVRTLAPSYFPNVSSEAIAYVANGVTGGANTTGVETLTKQEEYGSFVYILADLEKLAAAELFVGTFSSNVGRFVVVLREGLGKPRNSSISLDQKSWYPGRQRSLLMN